MVKLIIKLNRGAKTVLMKPVNGQGGFQTLVKKLQQRLHDNEIWVTTKEIVRIHKYATKTGQAGGFQKRLNPLLGAVQEITNACVEMYAN